MRSLKLNIALFLLFGILGSSCNDTREPQQEANTIHAGESLVKANRYLVKLEKEEIESYIRRHGWEMLETGTGLRYFIFEQGDGALAEKGEIAVLKYTTRTITGDLIYSSKEDGLKSFLIGHGGVESGLEEIILLLRTGDKARVIIPSHLAFGLLGDDNKIPARASLVYEIELIELK